MKLSKEEAFAEREGIKNIPLDFDQHSFKFTKKWFRIRNQKTFSTYLPPKFNGKKPINMIQIGVFEGYDLCWNLQNCLKHPKSRVVAIDPWLPTRKLDKQRMDECHQRAEHNLRPNRNKVSIKHGLSQKELPLIAKGISIGGTPIHAGDWDLVVIDGDHHAPAIYTDAMYAFDLLKKGGWLLFDDYFNRTRKKHHVQEGVSDFLLDHGDHVKLVWNHKYCICLEKL